MAEQGRVLVFGATGGIGGALARRLAAAGRAVALGGRDRDRLSALAAALDGADHSIAPADVTDAAALRAAVAAAGPLAGLAFCVGSIPLKPLARVTEAELLDAFRLNALAAALAVQAAAPALRPGAGVVLFSSVAARAGFPGHAAIGMAKAAVEGLALALAAELAPRIRVNCIAPSLTRTGLAAPLLANPQMAEALARQHPLQRLGEAEDAAALAEFLLSDAAGWITGQVIGVDGGRAGEKPGLSGWSIDPAWQIPIPRRAALLAASLGLPALLAAPARAALPGPYAFRIIREGREIGTHRVTFTERGGGQWAADTAVDIAVRLAGITVFRFTHRFQEVWGGGRLLGVASRRDRNGTVTEMRAEATPAGVVVQGPGGRLTLPAEAAPLTWWDVTRIEERRPLFDNAEGKALALTWTRAGLPGGGRRWSCTGDREAAGDWAADGSWTGWTTKGDDGSVVTYQRA